MTDRSDRLFPLVGAGVLRPGLEADHSPVLSAWLRMRGPIFPLLNIYFLREHVQFTFNFAVSWSCSPGDSSSISGLSVWNLDWRDIISECLTLRRLMSYIYIYIYIYGAPILDVSRSHTTTQHNR